MIQNFYIMLCSLLCLGTLTADQENSFLIQSLDDPQAVGSSDVNVMVPASLIFRVVKLAGSSSIEDVAYHYMTGYRVQFCQRLVGFDHLHSKMVLNEFYKAGVADAGLTKGDKIHGVSQKALLNMGFNVVSVSGQLYKSGKGLLFSPLGKNQKWLIVCSKEDFLKYSERLKITGQTKINLEIEGLLGPLERGYTAGVDDNYNRIFVPRRNRKGLR